MYNTCNIIQGFLSFEISLCFFRDNVHQVAVLLVYGNSVYSADEINTILESIDRTTNTGKRNYCIVLIAARLGLRSCEIAGLTFSNINYSSDVIQLIQKKTGEPIEFPLLPEIKESLQDYIKMQDRYLTAHTYF